MSIGQTDYKYIAYIDESGDDGIKTLRPLHPNGSSEWLILSAVVILASREHEPLDLVRSMISAFKNHQKPVIHFNELNPAKRSVACSMLAMQPVRCFTVASNKKKIC